MKPLYMVANDEEFNRYTPIMFFKNKKRAEEVYVDIVTSSNNNIDHPVLLKFNMDDDLNTAMRHFNIKQFNVVKDAWDKKFEVEKIPIMDFLCRFNSINIYFVARRSTNLFESGVTITLFDMSFDSKDTGDRITTKYMNDRMMKILNAYYEFIKNKYFFDLIVQYKYKVFNNENLSALKQDMMNILEGSDIIFERKNGKIDLVKDLIARCRRKEFRA